MGHTADKRATEWPEAAIGAARVEAEGGYRWAMVLVRAAGDEALVDGATTAATNTARDGSRLGRSG